MDIQLHYIEKGQGEPLLLLHGNGENADYFHRQIEYFSKTYRIFAIETRGHGKSPRGYAPFTIRQFTRDLYNFMEQQKLENANILGFSDGGNIALLFAIQYPKKVRRLILNGANLNARGVKPHVQIPIEIGYRIAALFSGKSCKAKEHAELLGLMVNDPDIPEEQLSKVTMPVLVIAGTKDMIKEKHTRRIAEKLPYAKLSWIPGDHFIASKNPEAFNQAVENFLQTT